MHCVIRSILACKKSKSIFALEMLVFYEKSVKEMLSANDKTLLLSLFDYAIAFKAVRVANMKNTYKKQKDISMQRNL